jgi:hypothetical protein
VRRTVAIAVLLLCGYLTIYRTRPTHPAPVAASPLVDNPSIARAIADHAHDVTVDAAGVVSRVLPDDRDGERH